MIKVYVLVKLSAGRIPILVSNEFWTSINDAHYNRCRDLISKDMREVGEVDILPLSNDNIQNNKFYAQHRGGYTVYEFRAIQLGLARAEV